MSEQVFVGREHELAALDGFLDRAAAGAGQVVFITGEAGSGKSTLVAAFERHAVDRHPDLVVAGGNCNQQTGLGDPYLPFREIMAALTGASAGHSAQTADTPAAKTMRTYFARSAQVLIDIGPDLVGTFVPGAQLVGWLGKAVAREAGLLGKLDKLAEGKHTAEGHTAEGHTAAKVVDQGRILEEYTNVINALAAEQPILIVVDDLQWADAASLDLLFHLSRRIEHSRVLLLGAYRPDEVALGRDGERHPLEKTLAELKRYYGDIIIDLSQVSPAEGRRFVDELLDSEPNQLGEGFRRALGEHAGGHALFTVELLRAMQERGDLVHDAQGRWTAGPTLDWDTLPKRVEGVIEERIGRLDGKLHEILGVASVEGVSFTAQVIARVEELRERTLLQQLSQDLEKRHRLVRELGEVHLGETYLTSYQFTHALIQHYLYDELGAGELRLLHGDIGQALEDLYQGHTDEIVVQLARHFAEAGRDAKAIVYLRQAGDQALRVSANAEAIEHFTAALSLVARMPAGTPRLQEEFALQVALGTPLQILYGYGAPQPEKVFQRALELGRQLGNPPEIVPLLGRAAHLHLVQGHQRQALALAEETLALAQQYGGDDLLMEAHTVLGACYFTLGEFVQAQEHIDQALALYNFDRHNRLTYLYGQDPGVHVRIYAGLNRWCLGFPDQAQTHMDDALALAERTQHPHTTAFALTFSAVLRQLYGDVEGTLRQAQAAIALSARHEMHQWLTGGKMMAGWALVQQGQWQQGFAEFQSAAEIGRNMQAGIFIPYMLSLRADIYRLSGQADQSLALLDNALAYGAGTGEQWGAALIHGDKAALLFAQGGWPQAAAQFQIGLDLARRQQARAPELRLALRQYQAAAGGDAADQNAARADLAAVCSRFTEGFAMPDLAAAQKALGG